MSERRYRCQVCDATWADFYDTRSHVYTSHGRDTCGIAEWQPEFYVVEVPADA